MTMAIRQPNTTKQRNSRTGLEFGSNQAGAEIYPFTRPTLPPIDSIQYATSSIEPGFMFCIQHQH